MATSEPGDPRLGRVPAESEEASVRPVVALRRAGPSGLALGLTAIVAGAILFGVLDAQRRSLSQPSVRMRAADAAQTAASPPPPLYIPPPPPPVQVVAPVVEPVAPPRPVPPPPPPPPQIVYVPQPAPQVIQQQPQPPPRGNTGGPALVIDTTSAPASAPGTGISGPGDVPGNVAGLLGTVSAGGRVRAGAFANRSATVQQGTLIPAVLETAFDSTRPGLARAIVSRDIRGFDGTRILIPRGSRLVGEYRTDAATGQKRAMINWSRLIRPDGTTIAIGSPAADTLGRGGIRAHVNSHFFERFAGALLQTALDVGASLGSRAATGNVILALPGSTTSFASPLIQTNRIVPTLTVAAGTSISVFVAHDLDFSGGESRK
ncbi:MAG: virB10 [Alphaproteobacteria bacterium]|nr:virB10 [Alphaproteobacteria bacterium]